jgi:hypothetical protein
MESLKLLSGSILVESGAAATDLDYSCRLITRYSTYLLFTQEKSRKSWNGGNRLYPHSTPRRLRAGSDGYQVWYV